VVAGGARIWVSEVIGVTPLVGYPNYTR